MNDGEMCAGFIIGAGLMFFFFMLVLMKCVEKSYKQQAVDHNALTNGKLITP